MRASKVTGLFLILALGCRDSAFQAASRVDSLDGWRRFVSGNPQDEGVELAMDRLDELSFEQAQKTHSVLAYKRYLEEFPRGEQALSATKLLESLRFNAAMEKNTPSAWWHFLSDHPDGAHRAQAEERLEALELQSLTTSDDVETLAVLAKQHPEDPRVEQANKKIEEAAWSKAQSAHALFAYLRAFPAGIHRDEAKTKLLELRIEGLLVSGAMSEALNVAGRAPLAKNVANLGDKLKRAEDIEALLGSHDAQLAQIFRKAWLRPFEVLLKEMTTGDSWARWQAAEELGAYVSVLAIDPLLDQIRVARSALVRQRAFESLGRVLKSLPAAIAEYEVASRVEALSDKASDQQLVLTLAVLFDLSGQHEKASAEYQRMWDASSPDPLVLRRWADIRRQRGQYYSAAVMAKQLTAWAHNVTETAPEVSLYASRELCGAHEMARFAEGIIEEVSKKETEFPDDVTTFLLRARATRKIAEAKLRDVELQMLAEDPHVSQCANNEVATRLAQGEAQQLAALNALKKKQPRNLPLIFEVLRERDPSVVIRAAAKDSR